MTALSSANAALRALLSERPEAAPWLALYDLVLEEAANPVWVAAAAATRLAPERAPGAPLLTEAVIPLDAAALDDWLRRLCAVAAEAGPEAASLATATAATGFDPPALLAAAIAGDPDELAAQAIRLGVDPAVLSTVLALASMPLLRALRAQWGGAVPGDWHAGACPCCGAWATIAEHRGLERARRLRCSRCGADWGLPTFVCAFCGETDHQRLGALIPEGAGESRRVETCDTCRGYLKALATLRAWSPADIPLADLGSMELDMAALERDFARPEAPAAPMPVRIVATS
ncbi:MAG: formate dehydrogenase accessory protein FdhE [Thermomicrobiales bacterium]|nr:formate dehydrogenase accessory protein FdhE [Thermomicrobiales bacterium]